MKSPLPKSITLLRAGFLVLLLLGASIKPMLASICDVHAIGHALVAKGHDDRNVGADATPEHQVDRDHADGKHGNLHDYDHGGAYANLVAEVVLPEVRIEQVAISLPIAIAMPLKRVSAPFRPPIV